MPGQSPFSWNPRDLIEVSNISNENLLLDLKSGPVRLDLGRTLHLTASAMEQPPISALVKGGKIKVRPYRQG